MRAFIVNFGSQLLYPQYQTISELVNKHTYRSLRRMDDKLSAKSSFLYMHLNLFKKSINSLFYFSLFIYIAYSPIFLIFSIKTAYTSSNSYSNSKKKLKCIKFTFFSFFIIIFIISIFLIILIVQSRTVEIIKYR
jgi:hypothetical protein